MLGLNLILGDRDSPHDRSLIQWGDGQTLLTGVNLGDLVLIDADRSGSISISTRWEDPSAPLPRAVVELVPASGSGSLRIRMDDDGTSDLVFPQDRYSVHLIWPGRGDIDERSGSTDGRLTSLYLDLPLRPTQGLRAGEGRGHCKT